MTGWPAPQLALPAGPPVWPGLDRLQEIAREGRHRVVCYPPRMVFVQYATPEAAAASVRRWRLLGDGDR